MKKFAAALLGALIGINANAKTIEKTTEDSFTHLVQIQQGYTRGAATAKDLKEAYEIFLKVELSEVQILSKKREDAKKLVRLKDYVTAFDKYTEIEKFAKARQDKFKEIQELILDPIINDKVKAFEQIMGGFMNDAITAKKKIIHLKAGETKLSE